MKTVHDVESLELDLRNELTELRKNKNPNGKEKRRSSKISKELGFLKDIRLFLEKENTSRETLVNQRKDLSKHLEIISSRWGGKLLEYERNEKSKEYISSQKTLHNKTYNVSTLKKHLNTITFILDKQS